MSYEIIKNSAPPIAESVDVLKLPHWIEISEFEKAIRVAKKKGATHLNIIHDLFNDKPTSKDGAVFCKLTNEDFKQYLKDNP